MPKTIVILENDEEIRQIIQTRLTESNYSVVCPVDSYVAIEFAQEHDVDLFILNDQMPIINGKDTLTILKNLQIQLPTIVFLSKNGNEKEYNTLSNATCLQKPFQIDNLVQKVSALLNM